MHPWSSVTGHESNLLEMETNHLTKPSGHLSRAKDKFVTNPSGILLCIFPTAFGTVRKDWFAFLKTRADEETWLLEYLPGIAKGLIWMLRTI